MIFIAGVDSYVNGSMEATTFLGAVLALIALMLVLFIYINRKWCFHHSHHGGFPCCNDVANTLPSKYIHKMARQHRSYEPHHHAGSDSDEDMLRRLRVQQHTASSSLHSGISSLSSHPLLSNYGGGGTTTPVAVTAASTSAVAVTAAVAAAASAAAAAAAAAGPTAAAGNYAAARHQQMMIRIPHTQYQQQRRMPEACHDPLGVAERGKVGLPPSSSECSSNSSSVVDAALDSGTMGGGLKKDRRALELAAARSFDSKAAALRETRIDRIEQRRHIIERRNSTNSAATNASGSSKYRKIGTSLPRQDSLDDMPDVSNNNQDEPLFDTSDLQSLKSDADLSLMSHHMRPTSPSCSANAVGAANSGTSSGGRNGSVEIALLYDAPMRKMTVHVIQARGMPSREGGGGQQTHTQVRLLMLPSKKQKHKTKIRSGENPQFIESFLLHRVNPEEVNSMGLRVRVYGCERMRRERLIGESIVSFATIDLELETNLWLQLDPRSSSELSGSSSDLLSLARSDSTGSTASMQHGGVPELLLALGYNGVTGRLNVEVVKGSHFRNLTLNKAPDTYVKLCLVSSMGEEMARTKTSTRRGQPNPLFKETFVFQVALFQLNDVTLMVSVYAKRSMKRNEMVGWFSLGLNCSGPEELDHWTDMREATRGELLARWHILVDS